jgi:uncharacterized protein YndB with AHSA1/START domain
MRIALIILGAFAVLVIIVVAVGLSLPVKHSAVGEARFRQSPAEIFAVIIDVKNFPTWRPSVKNAEMLPDSAGRKRFRETGSDGSILYEIEQAAPNTRLVTRIADRSLPFGGSWTYELIPDGDSTILRITEDGEVYNPIFRFVSRFVMGHTATINRYLRDLGAHLAKG